MSKKLAESLDGLVLDIKTGSGAFITEPERSLELARTMIGLGEARGCRTVALLTAMDRPLGRACGNALEVREAIAGLRGEGPADLMAVTLALGVEMLVAAGRTDRTAAGRELAGAIASGAGLDRFRLLVEAQGGDPRVVDHPERLPRAARVAPVVASRSGVVVRVEPRPIGHAITMLGGGRLQSSDPVDPAVGVEVLVQPGDRVEAGAPLAIVHAATEPALARARDAIRAAIPVADRADPSLPLLSHRVTRDRVEALS
jgi:thymidine phosphorylase